MLTSVGMMVQDRSECTHQIWDQSLTGQESAAFGDREDARQLRLTLSGPFPLAQLVEHLCDVINDGLTRTGIIRKQVVNVGDQTACRSIPSMPQSSDHGCP